jgi:3-oxoacyl-[acyl-carrier protein] reductase
MDLGITGRRAAVAGASAGLGFETARALANEGVAVAICGRDAGRITAAAEAIGSGCVPLVCDVSDAGGGARFVEMATEALGGVDILVANAGGPPPGNFASTPLDAYQTALDLSLMSVVGMCSAAVPAMQERRWGRVLAITSVSVRQPIPTLILSNTARAGVTGFLKTLALEVAPDGVTVNSIQPGLHATDRLRGLYPGGDTSQLAVTVPARTVGDPADFGHMAAMLCSEHARFTTGAHLNVDGGSYAGLQ